MTVGILGNKIGMTQIFDKKGKIIPVTIIKAGPCFISQIKTVANSGYNAVQLAYSPVRGEKSLTRPELGHFKKNNIPACYHLKEYKLDIPDSQFELGYKLEDEFTLGKSINLNYFEVGHFVNISGLTIGKGNAGNIKRNHFTRGPMGHGSKHHRLQGSIGSGTTPGRVLPGKKMPGRLGMEKRTIRGLEIIDIYKEENIIIVKGSIPGKKGSLVDIH